MAWRGSLQKLKRSLNSVQRVAQICKGFLIAFAESDVRAARVTRPIEVA